MGLFDDLRITAGPLAGAYQTKDLDCAMLQFVVGDDGLLLREEGVFEERLLTAEERAECEEEVARGGFTYHAEAHLRTGTMSHRIGFRYTPELYSGEAEIYDYDSKTGRCTELVARFYAGVLTTLGVKGSSVSVAPARGRGPVTLVVGVPAEELRAMLPDGTTVVEVTTGEDASKT